MDLVIFILGIIVLAIAISVLQIETETQKSQIDKLHFECENYLKVLAEVGAIPEELLKQKIKQMNQKYGEIKLKIK